MPDRIELELPPDGESAQGVTSRPEQRQDLSFIEPGSPGQYPNVESFH
ncbi:MAG: hypothetical protein ACYDD0_04025 [Candidatus Dormibacteria bacterium]